MYGRLVAMERKHPPKVNLRAHKAGCKICQSKDRDLIEMDYIHCIPWTEIGKRYGLNDGNIRLHANALELYKKRDRKNFYWNVINNFDLKKITAAEAIEAGKQLDRIERVVQESTAPTNIAVIYSWGKGITTDGKAIPDAGHIDAGSPDRLPAVTDTREVPPLP